MSQKDDDLIELRKYWYDKLKKNGFKDIETIHGTIKDWPAARLRRDYTPERFKEKQTYYQIASQVTWEYCFESPLEKQIWELHSDGYSLRDISKKIRTDQNKMNKDKIKKIIGKISQIVYSRMLDAEE